MLQFSLTTDIDMIRHMKRHIPMFMEASSTAKICEPTNQNIHLHDSKCKL
jgi:hypothetical protein